MTAIETVEDFWQEKKGRSICRVLVIGEIERISSSAHFELLRLDLTIDQRKSNTQHNQDKGELHLLFPH
jgi:hypothetical protein